MIAVLNKDVKLFMSPMEGWTNKIPPPNISHETIGYFR